MPTYILSSAGRMPIISITQRTRIVGFRLETITVDKYLVLQLLAMRLVTSDSVFLVMSKEEEFYVQERMSYTTVLGRISISDSEY